MSIVTTSCSPKLLNKCPFTDFYVKNDFENESFVVFMAFWHFWYGWTKLYFSLDSLPEIQILNEWTNGCIYYIYELNLNKKKKTMKINLEFDLHPALRPG